MACETYDWGKLIKGLDSGVTMVQWNKVVMRRAAYDSLPFQTRRQLHMQIADWMEKLVNRDDAKKGGRGLLAGREDAHLVIAIFPQVMRQDLPVPAYARDCIHQPPFWLNSCNLFVTIAARIPLDSRLQTR